MGSDQRERRLDPPRGPPVDSASLRAAQGPRRRDRTKRRGRSAGGNVSRKGPSARGNRKAERPKGHSAGKEPPTPGKAVRPAPAARRERREASPAGVRRQDPHRAARPERTGPGGRREPRGSMAATDGDEGGRSAARRATRRRSGLSDPGRGRLGAPEPEGLTGTERFGGRGRKVSRALLSLPFRVGPPDRSRTARALPFVP